MKLTHIKWDILPEKPEELLKLPREIDLPAELFFESVIKTNGLKESVYDVTFEEVIHQYLIDKFKTDADSFEIEMGEVQHDKEALNRLIDDRIDMYGIRNTICYLLDIGYAPANIINDLRFDEEDVKAVVEEEIANYPEGITP